MKNIYLCFILIAISCTNNSDDSNNSTKSDSPYIKGTVSGNLNTSFIFTNYNGLPCTGVNVIFTKDELTGFKTLGIGGVSGVSNVKSITIAVGFDDIPSDGNFILGGVNESNSGGYMPDSNNPYNLYITNENNGGFLKITEYNEYKQTITGNFQFIAELNETDILTGKKATFKGDFYNIPINDFSDANNPKGPCYNSIGSSLYSGGSSGSLPALTTLAISSITQNSATSGGIITSEGSFPITSRGVCWSTSVNPTISLNTKTINGTGKGTFSSSISGLTNGITYYVRAYATNNNGTAYGNQVSFKTGTISNLIVGAAYQGGLIAYIYKSGDPPYIPNEVHGIIVTPDYLPPVVDNGFSGYGTPWSNGNYAVTGATAKELGAGSSNTIKIVNKLGQGQYAAKLCYDLVLGGYSDWYLPSWNEIIKVNSFFQNKSTVIDYPSYWSSTELDANQAMIWWNAAFLDSYGRDKSYLNQVRAIRYF
jgi:hypothetical protein